MDAIARPFRTKADKIRALARASVAPADIARHLSIRYQHAYNVIKRSGLAGDRVAEATVEAPAAGPISVTIDSSGRVAIPENVLNAWGITAGDEVLMASDGAELRLFTRAAGLRLAQSIVRKYVRPGESLARELIRDRKREVENDDG